MKCDKLKTVCYIDAYSTMPVYGAKDVDEAIAELKAENERLDDLAHAHNLELLQKENIIAELKDKIQDLKVIISQKEDAINKAVDIAFNIKKERDFTKRALWLARAAAAEFWANYWFDVAPSESIKYDRIGRMKGVEKECVLTKVTKHMTASDWVWLWEKVERLCRAKAEEYK